MHFPHLKKRKRRNLARHFLFVLPPRCTNKRLMRDIPHFQPLQETQTKELCETSFIFHPLQETQTSELRETSFILHPLRCTNERIMRDIPHVQPLQETQTKELRETSFILHPLRSTNERIMRDIPHFSSPKRHKRANYARHS